MQGPYKAVGAALEVIPRTLAQNCGANVIRTLTKLRAKHAEKANTTFGIDGNKGMHLSTICFTAHASSLAASLAAMASISVCWCQSPCTDFWSLCL